MIVFILGFSGMLAIAVASAVVTWRLGSGPAWQSAFNKNGLGLTVEVVTLILSVLSFLVISIAMRDAFRELFFLGGWRSPWYLTCAGIIALVVLAWVLIAGPRALAKLQQVPPEQVGRDCQLPYLAYAPYVLIEWVGIALPMLAMIFLSIASDQSAIHGAMTELAARSESIVALAHQSAAKAASVPIYNLDYQDAAAIIEIMVSRCLWVVGIFTVFSVVTLNTRISIAYAPKALDLFKWIMWGLLMMALVVIGLGMAWYQEMRLMALGTAHDLATLARSLEMEDILLPARELELELRNQGMAHFLRQVLHGGSPWLLFFTCAAQIVIAKASRASVAYAIFPNRVATFLKALVLTGDEPAE